MLIVSLVLSILVFVTNDQLFNHGTFHNNQILTHKCSPLIISITSVRPNFCPVTHLQGTGNMPKRWQWVQKGLFFVFGHHQLSWMKYCFAVFRAINVSFAGIPIKTLLVFVNFQAISKNYLKSRVIWLDPLIH